MGLEKFKMSPNFIKFSNSCPKTDFFKILAVQLVKFVQICQSYIILRLKTLKLYMQKFSNFSQIFVEKWLRMRPTRQNFFLKNRIKRANFEWWGLNEALGNPRAPHLLSTFGKNTFFPKMGNFWNFRDTSTQINPRKHFLLKISSKLTKKRSKIFAASSAPGKTLFR